MKLGRVAWLVAVALFNISCGGADGALLSGPVGTEPTQGIGAEGSQAEPWSEFSEDAAAFIVRYLPPLDLLLSFRSNSTGAGCTEAEAELRRQESMVRRDAAVLEAFPLRSNSGTPVEPLPEAVSAAIRAQADYCAEARRLEDRLNESLEGIPPTPYTSQDRQLEIGGEMMTATRELIYAALDDYRPEMLRPVAMLRVTTCRILETFPAESRDFRDELAEGYLEEFRNLERRNRISLGSAPRQSVDARASELFQESFGGAGDFQSRLCP